MGAVVDSVEAGSLAEEAGILPGDVLLSINGQTPTDLIDYRFAVSDETLEIVVRRGDEEHSFSIEKDAGEGLGIAFTDAVFDGIRTCRNSCVFCFIHQMPAGMRETLYVEDDDPRLSVTHGNYVTLTNLTEEDLDRIFRLHLSPLYVSVHATDPKARVRMVRNKRAGDLVPLMRRIADHGIEMHCQVVLCPGYNDGEVLDQTISELADLAPAVLSIAVVPLGMTRFREKLTPLSPVDEECARRTLAQIEGWRRKLLPRLGTRFVFAADELYLKAGARIPPADAYEEFPQVEDGIGLTRMFLDEMDEVRGRPARPTLSPERILLVTGALAAPMLSLLALEMTRLTGHIVEPVAVPNRFFGESITVAGLLTARDILRSVRAAGRADRVFVPTVLLKEDRFLDDITVEGMAKLLGTRVQPVAPSPEALAMELLGEGPLFVRERCAGSKGHSLYITERSVR